MIQRDNEGEIILRSPIVPEVAQMLCGEEIPLIISEGPVPLVLMSNMGEEQPQDQIEATVLHYCDDSVVIICGNGQETILTS